MTRFLLNGSAYEPPEDAVAWGDLLDRIDEDAVKNGGVVTDVRFDGLDVPAYRDAQALAMPLAQATTVEVETGTAASLMLRCLADGAQALTPLAEATRDTAARFRSGDVETAREGLAALAESLGSLVGLVRAAAATLQVDLDVLECGPRRGSQLVASLTAHLDDLIEAHALADWPELADLLEVRVAQDLQAWHPVFAVLGARAEQ